MTTVGAGSYPLRLARTWVLCLVLATGWMPLQWLVFSPVVAPESGTRVLIYFLLLGLAPIPAVTSATLLVRDFGWPRGLLGAPAAILAVTTPGVCNAVRIALAQAGGA